MTKGRRVLKSKGMAGDLAQGGTMGSNIKGVVGTSGISGKVVEVFQHWGTGIRLVERHL